VVRVRAVLLPPRQAYSSTRGPARPEATKVNHFEIHGETQPLRNGLTGKMERLLVYYHVVVAGTQPDETGHLHAVCGAIVDLLPWTRALRGWLAITEKERCPSCDERVGEELRRLIELETIGVWGWR
jgi:hypothetical protein